VEDRSRGQRKPGSGKPRIANVEVPLIIGAPLSASRTHEAIRPATGGQITLAVLFACELPLDSRKVLGNDGRGTASHYICG